MVLSSIDCCGTRPCAGGRRSTHNIATQAYAVAKRRAGQPYRRAIHPSQQRRTRLFQPSGFTASCSVRRMIVPDTNVLSELMRPTPNPSGVAWLDVVSGRAGVVTTLIPWRKFLAAFNSCRAGDADDICANSLWPCSTKTEKARSCLSTHGQQQTTPRAAQHVKPSAAHANRR